MDDHDAASGFLQMKQVLSGIGAGGLRQHDCFGKLYSFKRMSVKPAIILS